MRLAAAVQLGLFVLVSRTSAQAVCSDQAAGCTAVSISRGDCRDPSLVDRCPGSCFSCEFDPASTLCSYVDVGSCGPRGDDASFDAGQCPHGVRTIAAANQTGTTVVRRIGSCQYVAFACYECATLPPSKEPTGSPIPLPTTVAPTRSPTAAPSKLPSAFPTPSPSRAPASTMPTAVPSPPPSSAPSMLPSASTTRSPTVAPSKLPSAFPTLSPTFSPSKQAPTMQPSESPSVTGVQLVLLTIPNLTLDDLAAAQWGEIERAAVLALTARFAIDRREVTTTQLRSSQSGSVTVVISLAPTGSNAREAQRVAAEVTVAAPIRIVTTSADHAVTSASEAVVTFNTTVRIHPTPGAASDSSTSEDTSEENELSILAAVVIGVMVVLLGFVTLRIHRTFRDPGKAEEITEVNPAGDAFESRTLPELDSASTIGDVFGGVSAPGQASLGRPVSAHFYPESASGGVLGSDVRAASASPISLKSLLPRSPTTSAPSTTSF